MYWLHTYPFWVRHLRAEYIGDVLEVDASSTAWKVLDRPWDLPLRDCDLIRCVISTIIFHNWETWNLIGNDEKFNLINKLASALRKKYYEKIVDSIFFGALRYYKKQLYSNHHYSSWLAMYMLRSTKEATQRRPCLAHEKCNTTPWMPRRAHLGDSL